MIKEYYYKGILVRKSTREKSNYRYAIVGNYKDGTFYASSCSCNCNRLAKKLSDMKAYYTLEKLEKARKVYINLETSETWYDSLSMRFPEGWTKEEALETIKKDIDVYERIYYFWKNAKVVELEVVVK